MRSENQDQAASPASSDAVNSALRAPHSALNFRPTREGVLWAVAALAMLFAGSYKLINLLILLGYFMLVLLAVNMWLARRSAYRVRIQRARSEPAFAGAEAARMVTVTNTASRNGSVTILETSDAHRVEVFVPVLAPGESRTVLAAIRPPRRGRYPTSPMFVIAGYPFGLINYTVPSEPPDTLVVLPTLGHVDGPMLRRWLIRIGAGDNFSRRPVRRHAIQAADVRGVRGYRPGDSPRDIHWRTTARQGELMVREYDSTEPLDLLMVVEPWVPANPTAADQDVVEATFQLAASVFWSWCHGEETPEATLVVAGSSECRSGRATEGFGRLALTLLAEAEPTTDTSQIPADGLRRRSNRCARILISSRPNSPLAAELRQQTGVPFVTADPGTPMAWYTPPNLDVRPGSL
ncbi:DUF58 domain-containing protein [Limnoglobus roseus]|uniref:DUF58 domain-containing protein n=1 Tax=Limnoglobus roseus TaxID=2598579 RepID=A0A5C1AD27_9BACT|nr:DUF58 domain-containing protein [Limnoglobus roseus]QEL15014.1 hypothetical protein PX52LOC_01919 [Limnoglobus roseus]